MRGQHRSVEIVWRSGPAGVVEQGKGTGWASQEPVRSSRSQLRSVPRRRTAEPGSRAIASGVLAMRANRQQLLEPIYEQDFPDCSYGFRPGRSAHQALERLWKDIMQHGGRWILDLDISDFFGTIDHRQLGAVLDKQIRDGVVRRLIDKWLKAGVLEDGVRFCEG